MCVLYSDKPMSIPHNPWDLQGPGAAGGSPGHKAAWLFLASWKMPTGNLLMNHIRHQ